MAIRPTDLQTSYIQTVQQQPLSQRAEENPRVAQAAAQAAFVAQTEQRNESVAETGNLEGNRIEAEERRRDGDEPRGRRRRRHVPGTPYEEPPPVESAPSGEAPHLIDFTA